jgi:hypothetical protein
LQPKNTGKGPSPQGKLQKPHNVLLHNVLLLQIPQEAALF